MEPFTDTGIDTMRARFHTFALLLMLVALTACSQTTEVPDDVTTLEWIAPANGQEISGRVTLEVAAEHASSVKYLLDGEAVTLRTQAPFHYIWDSSLAPNGTHRLTARAEGVLNVDLEEIEIRVHNPGRETVIELAPLRAQLEVEESLRLDAAVFGPANRVLRWSVRDGAERGTIDQNGVYTAPAQVPRPPKATIVVRSISDGTEALADVVIVEARDRAGEPDRPSVD